MVRHLGVLAVGIVDDSGHPKRYSVVARRMGRYLPLNVPVQAIDESLGLGLLRRNDVWGEPRQPSKLMLIFLHGHFPLLQLYKLFLPLKPDTPGIIFSKECLTKLFPCYWFAHILERTKDRLPPEMSSVL